MRWRLRLTLNLYRLNLNTLRMNWNNLNLIRLILNLRLLLRLNMMLKDLKRNILRLNNNLINIGELKFLRLRNLFLFNFLDLLNLLLLWRLTLRIDGMNVVSWNPRMVSGHRLWYNELSLQVVLKASRNYIPTSDKSVDHLLMTTTQSVDQST